MEHMGSKYVGDTKSGRLEGEGQYTLPTKSTYVGQLKDGMFHGPGTLHFPDDKAFVGEWENGTVIFGHLVFPDDLETYVPDQSKWEYNTIDDRRYHKEICFGLKPAGRSMLRDGSSKWQIPKGFYDTGDGLYNPKNRIVYDYNMKFLRNADQDEHNWVLSTFEVKDRKDKYADQEEHDSKMNTSEVKDRIDKYADQKEQNSMMNSSEETKHEVLIDITGMKKMNK